MEQPSGSPQLRTANTGESPITDDYVSRLIAGTDVRTLAFYDVSDEQLYGCKYRRRLAGSLAEAAKAVGCDPVVYQAVLWWCLVYAPVVPRGIYFVLPCTECDDPDDDAQQYRAIPAQWDSRQVAFHYLVVFVPLVSVILALLLWWGL